MIYTPYTLRKKLMRAEQQSFGDGTTVRLLVRGVSNDAVDRALKNLQFRVLVRTWYEVDVESAIIKLMPSSRHDITSRAFYTAIQNRVMIMPGHDSFSLVGLGSTRFSSPGGRSKEGDEGLRCGTRIGPQSWPNVMIEVGYSESLLQLRMDVQWWLTSSGGLTKLAILVLLNDNPNNLHVEVWVLGPNPRRVTRQSQATIPVRTSLIDIDATGAVTPPGATLTIPYDALFDIPNANGTDVVLAANDLSLLALHIFVQSC
jgi:hypothetical protein